MNSNHAHTYRRSTLGAALAAVVLYIAVAIGIPWLLHDAPPSPEVAFASKVCCTMGNPAGH